MDGIISRIALRAANGRSDIWIGQPLAQLPKALARYAKAGVQIGIVADVAVSARYGTRLLDGLRAAGYRATLWPWEAGEKSKTLQQAGRLYARLARARFERGSWLLALGGGVTGDLVGFVAATYIRGLPFIQVPTTLLAQVDASIGGKTGVDIREGKNLVGAFHHPALVWIDPATLKSLPSRHWRTGMAEVIKYGAIWDEALFRILEEKIETLMKGFSPAWTPIITRCAEIKTQIVRRDPRETRGLRALLNFGHTIGHAIEAATDYAVYTHGEAISIGMFVAGFLSQQLDLLDGLDRIRLNTLLTKAGLPAQVRRPLARARLMEFLARDKKVQDGAVRFVLLKKLGQAVAGQWAAPEFVDAALSASGL